MKISRRSFLRGLLATAALPALPVTDGPNAPIRKIAEAHVPLSATAKPRVHLDMLYGIKKTDPRHMGTVTVCA